MQLIFSEDEMSWARAEWARRKKEIQKVYAGRLTWAAADAAMEKRMEASGFSPLRASGALIMVQQADSEIERERLRKKAAKYILGRC